MPQSAVTPTPGDAAFRLCELEWMRQRLIGAVGCESLATFVRELRDGFGEVEAAAVEQAASVVEQVEDVVGSAVAIPLPDTGVGAAAKEVEDAAVGALENGIADLDRALHAASWIDVRVGLHALATVLAEDDVFRFWETSVERFVASFRGAGAGLARAVGQQAGVEGTPFSALTPGQVQRLAAVLRDAGAS
jgi:hypothetical protein